MLVTVHEAPARPLTSLCCRGLRHVEVAVRADSRLLLHAEFIRCSNLGRAYPSPGGHAGKACRHSASNPSDAASSAMKAPPARSGRANDNGTCWQHLQKDQAQRPPDKAALPVQGRPNKAALAVRGPPGKAAIALQSRPLWCWQVSMTRCAGQHCQAATPSDQSCKIIT